MKPATIFVQVTVDVKGAIVLVVNFITNMQIQAPAVMPKWEWALSKNDEWLMAQWENKIMQDAIAYATQKNCAVNVYWDGKDAVVGVNVNLPVIGSATKNGCMLDNMRKYYAMKYL